MYNPTRKRVVAAAWPRSANPLGAASEPIKLGLLAGLPPILCLLLLGHTAVAAAAGAVVALACVRAARRHSVTRPDTDISRASRYRALFDTAAIGVALCDASGRIRDCNSAFAELLGYPSKDEVVGLSGAQIGHPDDPDDSRELMDRLLRGEISRLTVEKRYRRKDGSPVWARLSVAPIEGSDLYFGFIEDIGERKRAEDELWEIAAELERAQRAGGVGTWVLDAATGSIRWSREAQLIYGLSDDEVAGGEAHLFARIVHPDDRDRVLGELEQAFAGAMASDVEHRIVRADREIRWVRTRCDVECDAAGRPVRQLGVVTDITRSRLAQETLRQTAADLVRAQQLGRVGTWSWHPRERRGEWSAEARRIVGLGRTEAEAGDVDAFMSVVHPDDRADVARLTDEAFESAGQYVHEYRIVADGDVRWIRAQGDVERDEHGEPFRLVGVVIDITASKLAQEALRETAADLVRAQQLGRVGTWAWYPRENRNTWSAEARRIYGINDRDAATEDPDLYFGIIHPDDRESMTRKAWLAFETAGTVVSEHRILLPDGEVRWVRSQGDVECDEHGEPFRVAGVVIDVTDARRAEAEQRELESRLRQSQKLEALGQLAGGVAHDFNNLLTVIMGNAGLALQHADLGTRTGLEEILAAGERATGLVRQLLIFSRQQPVEARPIDLNEVVSDSRKMLNRLIEATIDIRCELAEIPVPVVADRGALEQVLLNLALNARDAMPDGGCLTIRTDAVVEGDARFGFLSVEDTGVGMDELTLQRIFEPFYTTKELGKGTGLGLAMVYGFVDAAGGEIDADSELGAGSTFTIKLPASESDGSATGHDRDFVGGQGLAGGCVLLVEDDEQVRGIAEEMLLAAGCEIVLVADAERAIALTEQEEPFDLLVTDLVMPTMTGIELAGRIRELRPELPVLFVSGYPGDILGDAAARPNTGYLPKPFSRADLQEALERLLAESS
jgi:PAS domain S-box-containing protein